MTRFETSIRSAEDKQRAVIETSNETARQAKVRLNSIGIEYLAAQQKIRDIKKDWEVLDEPDIATPADLAAAEADLTRAEIRIRAANSAANTTAKAVRSTDTRLAEIAAQALANAYADIPIHCTFADIGTARPARNELPLIVLTQIAEASATGDGALSGEVQLTYFRNDGIHKDLDLTAIGDAASRIDARIEAGAGGGSYGASQGASLNVWGHPALPVISNVSPADCRRLGAHLIRSVATQYADPGHSLHQGASGLLLQTPTQQTYGRMSVLNARCDGVESVDGAERTVTIEGVIVAGWAGSRGGPELADAFQDALNRTTGIAVDNLGRIASIEVVSISNSQLAMSDKEAGVCLRDATSDGSGGIRRFGTGDADAFHFKAVAVSEVGQPGEQAA
ncbi:hypothetical protein GCM10023350_06370 [Nocardioides endophyticus]|uniref:Uncharacterized protein n=1 Tax=Nocardioides endophyticus TaxID=1353775 RepID=A0ABP8YG37_9ACTN